MRMNFFFLQIKNLLILLFRNYAFYKQKKNIRKCGSLNETLYTPKKPDINDIIVDEDKLFFYKLKIY